MTQVGSSLDVEFVEVDVEFVDVESVLELVDVESKEVDSGLDDVESVAELVDVKSVAEVENPSDEFVSVTAVVESVVDSLVEVDASEEPTESALLVLPELFVGADCELDATPVDSLSALVAASEMPPSFRLASLGSVSSLPPKRPCPSPPPQPSANPSAEAEAHLAGRERTRHRKPERTREPIQTSTERCSVSTTTFTDAQGESAKSHDHFYETLTAIRSTRHDFPFPCSSDSEKLTPVRCHNHLTSLMPPDQRFQPVEAIVTEVVDGELVLLQLAEGIYFGLDLLGTEIWNWLTTGHSLGQISTLLSSRYPSEQGDTLKHDIESLVTELVAAKLVFPCAARGT